MDHKVHPRPPGYQALMRQIGGEGEELQGRVKQLRSAAGVAAPDPRPQVSNEMYTGMLNQAQQLDVARAGTVGNVRIVDAAEVDATTPVKPPQGCRRVDRHRVGRILSVALVLLKQLLNRVEDPRRSKSWVSRYMRRFR